MKLIELYDIIYDGTEIKIQDCDTGDDLGWAEDVYGIDDTFMNCDVVNVGVVDNTLIIDIDPDSM